MSFYVRRYNDEREGYVGPIRSPRQADREAAAWRADGWRADVLPSTPELRKTVDAWQRNARGFPGEAPR